MISDFLRLDLIAKRLALLNNSILSVHCQTALWIRAHCLFLSYSKEKGVANDHHSMPRKLGVESCSSSWRL
ncbi:hypothetical protein V6N13_036190 [Hibiscus sabdariffa]